MDVANLRKDYVRHGLLESEAPTDPLDLFRTWFESAVDAGLEDPNAMTLATATADGAPRARIVLLKGFDERGFCFFTNYTSSKARELDANPRAALVFYWHDFERQVRIEGAIERTTATESDAYFEMRPRDSRIGAHASPQSCELRSREELEARLAAELERFGTAGDVPRPDDWGGYRLVPSLIEFWQGRPARLHDRLVYQRPDGSSWKRARLAP
jgi:pyridoxamine 5'-phosphate oxidase